MSMQQQYVYPNNMNIRLCCVWSVYTHIHICIWICIRIIHTYFKCHWKNNMNIKKTIPGLYCVWILYIWSIGFCTFGVSLLCVDFVYLLSVYFVPFFICGFFYLEVSLLCADFVHLLCVNFVHYFFGGFCTFWVSLLCVYFVHLECHFFILESQSPISFSRSLLPSSIEKRPTRMRLENEIECHSKSDRLY